MCAPAAVRGGQARVWGSSGRRQATCRLLPSPRHGASPPASLPLQARLPRSPAAPQGLTCTSWLGGWSSRWLGSILDSSLPLVDLRCPPRPGPLHQVGARHNAFRFKRSSLGSLKCCPLLSTVAHTLLWWARQPPRGASARSPGALLPEAVQQRQLVSQAPQARVAAQRPKQARQAGRPAVSLGVGARQRAGAVAAEEQAAGRQGGLQGTRGKACAAWATATCL